VSKKVAGESAPGASEASASQRGHFRLRRVAEERNFTNASPMGSGSMARIIQNVRAARGSCYRSLDLGGSRATRPEAPRSSTSSSAKSSMKRASRRSSPAIRRSTYDRRANRRRARDRRRGRIARPREERPARRRLQRVREGTDLLESEPGPRLGHPVGQAVEPCLPWARRARRWGRCRAPSASKTGPASCAAVREGRQSHPSAELPLRVARQQLVALGLLEPLHVERGGLRGIGTRGL
jgi:hypothetical protein